MLVSTEKWMRVYVLKTFDHFILIRLAFTAFVCFSCRNFPDTDGRTTTTKPRRAAVWVSVCVPVYRCVLRHMDCS